MELRKLINLARERDKEDVYYSVGGYCFKLSFLSNVCLIGMLIITLAIYLSEIGAQKVGILFILGFTYIIFSILLILDLEISLKNILYKIINGGNKDARRRKT